jgi:hypothetical protein
MLFFAAIIPAQATMIKIYVGNGTGFFVNREGYIVTNEHVVSYCKQLTVSGIGGTRTATVLAHDQVNDLALLKIPASNTPFGIFSSLKTPLAKGDRVVIVGFPGTAVDAVTRDSKILTLDVPGGQGKWLGLGNVLEQGNSGGPLMDTSGNIIGVTSAHGTLLTYNKATKAEISRENFGMAITLPVLEKFLQQAHVRYQTADTDMYIPTSHITDAAREYIVKVRCEFRTEVR